MRFALKKMLVVLPLLALSMPAAPIGFYAVLNGASESPSNLSPGTGYASVVIDDVAHTLYVSVSFSNLEGLTSASHIHVIPVFSPVNVGGVATQTPSFVGFPTGVSSGSYSNTFDTTLASSFRAGFITENGGTVATAEAALFQAIADGRAYFNIHTNLFGGGEIRGTLEPVPEPATMALVGVVLAGLGLRRLRRVR